MCVKCKVWSVELECEMWSGDSGVKCVECKV